MHQPPDVRAPPPPPPHPLADLLAGTPVKGLPEPPPLGSPRFELSSPRFPLFQPSPKRPPLDSLRSPPTGAPRWLARWRRWLAGRRRCLAARG